ncbi:MAG: PAS domain-containing protein [Anaerolineae bacterium]|nr:PAS domain-containing protein [Anaerolineae bacterium]MCA9907958.1 PAS domain-containing protein [Anaerolineae bacterium]
MDATLINLALLVVHILLIGGLVLLLHALSPRFGFAPLLVCTGAMTALIQSQMGIYIEPFPGIVMFVTVSTLVPAVLGALLVVYVADGAPPARIMIASVLVVTVLVSLLFLLYRLHLTLPGAGTIKVLTVGEIVTFLAPDLRVTAASVVAFAADMCVIVVSYQGLKNLLKRSSDWLAIGLALMLALWADVIVFRIFADLGRSDFIDLLPGDALAKTISGLVLWPLLAWYLIRVAPRLPNYKGVTGRRVLDIFFVSTGETREALENAARALEGLEGERQREASYFRQIAETMEDALWLAEPLLPPFYVNPAYERIWGRDTESLRADKLAFANSLHPEDRERILAGLHRQVEGNYDVEFRIVRPDGSMRWVRDRAMPILNDAGQVYRIAGLTTDITEQKMSEQARLQLAVEREKVSLLREFIAEATHDLKTPLTSIKLKIHQIGRVDDPEKRARLLDEVQQQSSRMGKMIDDLLTLSRLESVQEFTITRIDLNKLLRDICQRIESLAHQRDIRLEQSYEAYLPTILGDEDDLSRAFSNLIENAIFYTPAAGSVTVKTALQDDTLTVEIIDTGIGVAAEDIDNIFQRFYRAPNARTADPGGTGLGLSIVKKVVEQHHGQIQVTSNVGQGTRFCVSLPFSDLLRLHRD